MLTEQTMVCSGRQMINLSVVRVAMRGKVMATMPVIVSTAVISMPFAMVVVGMVRMRLLELLEPPADDRKESCKDERHD